jgi:SAM-dependent methyltransferase
MYEHYAQFYDATGQIRYSLLFHQYLTDLLAAHPLPLARSERWALDLACGTGTFALLLADAGWRVTGVDRARAMLQQAQQKGEALQLAVEWVVADLRALPTAQLGRCYDLVTCLYDSLNYLLTDDDLAACFRAVAALLRPGGLFIADMNSRYVLQHVWVGCEVHEQHGYTQVQQIAFDAASDRSTLRLIGMVGDDEQGYARFEEQHTQRAYNPERVAALLQAAHLQVEAAYDAFTTASPGPEAQRFVWVCRK